MLRRLKADVLDDLPGTHRDHAACEAVGSRGQPLRSAPSSGRSKELEAAGEQGGQMRLLAHLTRLRLACCNPRLVLEAWMHRPARSSRPLAATLDDLLANRHRVLVFSQFVTHLRLVEEHLVAAKVDYQYLDGSTSAAGADGAHQRVPGGRWRCLSHFAQGGRLRLEPDRRGLRHPHGSVVESGR